MSRGDTSQCKTAVSAAEISPVSLPHPWLGRRYPTALAHGWDIGSGPTEAMCKNLTLRLKSTGMKWDTNNAAALMNLVALRESEQWYRYWQTRKIA